MWDIPLDPILCVDYGNPIDFWITATASNWGRREVSLAFCAAKRRLKTNLRTPNTLLTDYYRAYWEVPRGIQIPKFRIYTLVYVNLKGLSSFFWKKFIICLILVKIAKLATLAQFFWKSRHLWIFSSGHLQIDHKLPYMWNLPARVASGTPGHAR